MTPQQKIELIHKDHRPTLDKITAEVKEVMETEGWLDDKAKRLLQLLDQMAELFQPVSPCKEGCANCCNQSLVIFDWEADRIAEASGRSKSQFKGASVTSWSMEKRKEIVARYEGVACPFLVDNRCSVYEVRPLSCRVHISLEDSPDPCDIVNNPGARVAYVNMEAARWVWATLFVTTGRFAGDIREFFNDEKTQTLHPRRG